MQKQSVIVSELPTGVLGATEPYLDEAGKQMVNDKGEPLSQVVPNTLKLTIGTGKNQEHWRARLGVPTPIPEQFLPAIEKSGAVWRYHPATPDAPKA